MNWTRIWTNIAGVAVGCVALHQSGVAGDLPSWRTLGVAVLTCVLANQLGLHQEKP